MPGARILLVEDDDILRDLLTRNLTVREHEVSIAKDAQTALAYLRATPFDLGRYCAPLCGKDGSTHRTLMATARSCPSSSCPPSVWAQAVLLSFTPWRTFPNRFRWMRSCACQQRPHSGGRRIRLDRERGIRARHW